MALYAIGDLHLSLTANKPMEVFGPAWENYTERIAESLGALTAEDVLVLAGDTSWGMSLEEAGADFKFLDRFPCKKYLVKGNHDYWWTTAAKLHRFFDEKGIHTLDLLHNNCVFYGDYAVCGTRGWFLEEDAHNVTEGGGGEAHFVLPPLPAPVPGLRVPGDPGNPGEIPRFPVLLRPSPRPRHPPEAGGKAGGNGVFPDLRRLPGLCSEKNL